MVNELKWAEGVRPKVERIVLTRPVVTELDDLKITFDVRAAVIDTADEAIANAVIQEAIADGVAELYMLDREFVLNALREKIEREKTCSVEIICEEE